jgi:hypothetical protein
MFLHSMSEHNLKRKLILLLYHHFRQINQAELQERNKKERRVLKDKIDCKENYIRIKIVFIQINYFR